ncbi:response regulator [Aggregatimonas sangjinii]|uniref:histidine kinase n=1 Tax=Aggregatimonas sangjinii TaxID=2583587 RepID=A0A5B7SUL6_9FLAO|nr:hybrid sensor histidine kinase/response regulator transcription factor [Aggregatimonas sangjinii]QCX00979.1 response regulator [Aggregatimonas sangjinii]
MNKFTLVFSLILYFTFSQGAVFGQSYDISFRRISPPGGFTRGAIQSIAQDDQGYIWMGSRQGLIRYDSNNSKWFTPMPNDSLSLASEEVSHVFCDNENQIWVATNKGLCTFDRRTQNFERIEYVYENGSIRKSRVLSLLQTNDGRYLVIDKNNFGVLDEATKKLNRIANNEIRAPEVLYKDDADRIWLGTKSGSIFRFFPSTNSVKKLFSVDAKVTSIYAENDLIWVGTEENGAKVYNQDGEFIRQISFENTSKSPRSERVRAIKKDSKGRLWFGTDNGLYMDNGEVLKSFNPEDYPGIPHNSIFQIYEDNSGGVWVGTWSGGLALIHHSDNNFKTYRHSKFYNSISSNVVSSFIQIGENELLIGTEVGGLNSFDLSTEKFKTIPLDKENQVKNIKSLYRDKNGGIWAGTFRRGLWYKPAGASSFQVFKRGPDDGKHISSNSVYALHEANDGIWIGTFGGGINFYSFKTKRMRRCFLNNSSGIPMSNLDVLSILVDNGSNLWVGTLNNSLYRIHLPSGTIKKITNNRSSGNRENYTVYSLWQHSSGKILIGTKVNGVLTYNPDSNRIENFEDVSFLRQKSIYGIIEDFENNIWFSSNNGLVLYNPKNKSRRHFVFLDGIQGDIFSPQAVFRDDKGHVYFGGTNGFTGIDPNEIKVNSKRPYTIINVLNTNDHKSIYPVYGENLEINPIQLRPNETTFRINFSADNYLIPNKNRYKYRLLNYYDDWIPLENEGSVLFTGLEAGEYSFQVKASNNDGIWSDTPTQMTIIIDEYWYKTTFAYIIYAVLLATILYFISRFYLERLKLKREYLLEKNQRKNEEHIHEMKLKLFTNISHEFRTPLTLILWPLRQLIKSKNIPQKDRDNLAIAKRNAHRLLELINQIVELRKLEKGESKLNIGEVDIVKLVNEVQMGFRGEAESNQISFILNTDYSSLIIEADQQKLDTLIYNLLSNAYKYVQSHGQIKVTVEKNVGITSNAFDNQLSYGQISSDSFIQLTVEDDGFGIDNEDLFKIFNRFEQGKLNKKEDAKDVKGSGIGLSICKELTLLHQGQITVQSTLGKGSCFTILLPTTQKAQRILSESHQIVKNLRVEEEVTIVSKNEISQENRAQILVVEDNLDFSSFICDFLRDYYQVKYAINGSEGLAILKQSKIDVIVSDVMMPEMDGFEFCKIVKAQLETSHIPVILLTALSSSGNVLTGLDKGADAYLVKPFDERILLKRIENLLEQRRRIHSNFTKRFISNKTLEAGGLDSFFLNRIRAVIEHNLSDEDFSLEKLAEELMISRSNLHRKIKSLSGLSTTGFINLIRIECAVKLVREKNYRFNEVAYRVGFSSQSYFTRCFKKVYKVTPQEYFKNLRVHAEHPTFPGV